MHVDGGHEFAVIGDLVVADTDGSHQQDGVGGGAPVGAKCGHNTSTGWHGLQHSRFQSGLDKPHPGLVFEVGVDAAAKDGQSTPGLVRLGKEIVEGGHRDPDAGAALDVVFDIASSCGDDAGANLGGILLPGPQGRPGGVDNGGYPLEVAAGDAGPDKFDGELWGPDANPSGLRVTFAIGGETRGIVVGRHRGRIRAGLGDDIAGFSSGFFSPSHLAFGGAAERENGQQKGEKATTTHRTGVARMAAFQPLCPCGMCSYPF